MSMRLREWRSNSAAVNKEILPEDMNASAVMKILGLQWNSTDDTLRLGKSTQIDKITTKRVVLKELASIFDPLGLFAPVTLKARLFLQKLWKAEYDWDDPVEDTLKSEWKIISDDIHQLDTIYRERYVGNGDAQLLCFCDASGKAYSTTVYLRTQIDGIWNCNLIFAKSRITPTKKMSIPRLELLAMVIGVRSLKFVEKHLQLPITKKIIWTDSQCVLHWIKSTKPLSTFVTNRIKEIKNANSTEFRYVSTTCNPADIATRGLTSEEIKDSKLWWEGPAWITKDCIEEWPSWDIPQFNSDELNEIKNEEKQTKVLFEVSNINQEKSKTEHAITKMPFGIKIEDYSSIKKLTRITAWVFRFINNIKQETKIKGELISEEIIHAEVTWIKAI